MPLAVIMLTRSEIDVEVALKSKYLISNREKKVKPPDPGDCISLATYS